MRQLVPEIVEDVDVEAIYASDARPRPANRPWVCCVFVASADGAAELDGTSGGLGNDDDKRVFRVLRSLADIILVGAGTVRAESYGPPRLPEPLRARRVERGQTPLPRLAIVSGSLGLDLDAPLFTATDPPPVVVTTAAASTARRAEIADRADLLLAGQGDAVDPEATVAALGDLGADLVVCEGGPHLAGQLLEADLVDEWCLTLAPTLVGGAGPRPLRGAEPGRAHPLPLRRVLESDGYLFLRYARA